MARIPNLFRQAAQPTVAEGASRGDFWLKDSTGDLYLCTRHDRIGIEFTLIAGPAENAAATSGGASGAVAATTLTASGVTGLSGATTISGVTVLSNASITASALPTADPTIAGRLWNDAGTLKVSAGA